jgi:hypothetical protein
MLHDDIDRIFKRGFYAPQPQPPPPIEPFQRLEMYDVIAAVHESAHCVWNWVRHEPVHSVEINKQGAGGGEFKALPNSRVELSDGGDARRRASEDAPIVEALTDSATRVAWIKHLPAFAVGRHAQRRFGAKQKIFDDACAHDDEVISRIINLATPDPAERRRLHQQVEAEAREFVRLYWPEIQKLADELFERGFLNRDEITSVLGSPKLSEGEGLLDGVPFRRRRDGYIAPAPCRRSS